MYEASWEWLESRIGKEAMPIARAYMEFLIDQRQPVGREAPRNVPREKDRAEILEYFCRDFDTDLDDISDEPDFQTYCFFMKIYDHLASATDTFKILSLIQNGVWKEIPDKYRFETWKEKTRDNWTDSWNWERLKRFALIEPDETILGGYRISHPLFLQYGTRLACFFWEAPMPEHLKGKKKKKTSKGEGLKLVLTAKEPSKHCYKVDEPCFLCSAGPEGLMHRLLVDEVDVYPCRISGKVVEQDLQRDGYICADHLQKARTDATIMVVEP